MTDDGIPVDQVEMHGSRYPHLRVEMPRDVYARYRRASRRMTQVASILMEYHLKRASADECMARIDIVFTDS